MPERPDEKPPAIPSPPTRERPDLAPPPPSPTTRKPDPLTVAAFVVGIVGAVIGLVTPALDYFLPGACGIAAVVMGFLSRQKERSSLAVWAIILGGVALAEAA